MSSEIVIIFVLAGVCGYSFWLCNRLVREINRLKKAHEKINEKAVEKAEKTLENARDSALRIISEAKIISEDEERAMHHKLREALAEKIKSYEKVVERLSKNVELGTEQELDEFRKALRLETIEMEKNIAEKIEGEMAVAKKQVEEYREMKMKKLDEQIFEIIKDVASRVVGRVISESDQEASVRSALEEAKNEHIF